VAEIEGKLNGLLALLSGNETAEQGLIRPVAESTIFPSPPICEDGNLAFAELLESHPSLVHCDNYKLPSPFNRFQFPMMVDFNDVISKGVVHFNYAETCVQYFRTQSSSFPFVVVPDDWSLDFFRSRRPLLLLSIMCMATRSDQRLQHTLEFEMRATLSRSVLLNREKSLDIIQGILVYLAW
jgi:hypothetical protein